MEVGLILFGLSIVLFFGFFAEFIFKKTGIPDVLFLILLGLVLGPFGLKYISASQLDFIAPLFTTFALLFLLFDGAFSIDLASFAKGLTKALKVSLYNIFLSALIISLIMLALGFNPLISVLTGFILSDISEAFVIPLLKQIKIKQETYSVLTLDSAITDVFCIVFALTVVAIIEANVFNFQSVLSEIVRLFAVAGAIGIAAGIVWIILVIKVFKEHKFYMTTIAALLLVFFITEFLGGNGAIAALFFGLVLRNSGQLTSMFAGVMDRKYDISYKDVSSDSEVSVKRTISQGFGISVTSKEEQFFYSQISFFLKTFFFVYIGLLLSFADYRIVLIGIALSVAIMLARHSTLIITREFEEFDRKLIGSVFGRGLASAAIAQIIIFNNVPGAQEIVGIAYIVIPLTIILSSLRVFQLRRKFSTQQPNPAAFS
ncbi:MAG TPA: hypothetical protein HA227_05255 [Candidatus Diapherotrites archaeon]|uniref:Cation/H+ exchanger transmembrane domain-containing protein n=2 Tax=Candidatus Iainarchaeum sp. TaxID=3101447 RepID=A0A7J4KYT6_9ARCH|nr:hypothetical protein [Candidatus Diapherotrites archaeon]